MQTFGDDIWAAGIGREDMVRKELKEIQIPSCSKCGRHVMTYMPYCHWCGFKNSQFNHDNYVNAQGMTLEERHGKECRLGHINLLAAFRETSDIRDMPYCPDCGECVWTEELDDEYR